MGRVGVVGEGNSRTRFSLTGVITTIAGTGTTYRGRRLATSRVDSVTRCIRFGVRGTTHTLSIRRVRSVIRGRVVTRNTFRITGECIGCHCGHSLVHGSGAASRRVLALVRYGGRRIGRRGSGGGPAMGDIRHSCVTNRISGSLAEEVLLPRSVIRTRRGNVVRFRSTSCFTRRVRGYSLVGLRSVLRGNAIVDNAVVRGPRSFSATYGVTARVVTRVTSDRCNNRDVDLSRLTPFISLDEGGFEGSIGTRLRTTNVRPASRRVGGVARIHIGSRVGHNIRVVRCRIVALVAAGNRTPFIAIFVCLSRIPRNRAESSLGLVVRRILHREVRNIGGRDKI